MTWALSDAGHWPKRPRQKPTRPSMPRQTLENRLRRADQVELLEDEADAHAQRADLVGHPAPGLHGLAEHLHRPGVGVDGVEIR